MMGLDAGTRVAGYCHVRKHDDGQRNRSLTVNSSLRLIPNPFPSVLRLVTQRSELREKKPQKEGEHLVLARSGILYGDKVNREKTIAGDG